MREFFLVDQVNHDQFQIFSPLHFMVLVTLGVLILSIIIFRKSLNQRADFYRYLLVIVSLVLEFLSVVRVVGAGKWDLKTSLPLELCEITFILGIIMLIGKSYRLFEVAYFWGFTGSTLALIFPGVHLSYHHFLFCEFMLTHALNLISLVFMIAVVKYRPTRKSIRVSFIISNIYMLLMAAINYCLGSNYYFRYIFNNPVSHILNFLVYSNSLFFKIVMLEGVTFIAILIGYLPFSVTNVIKVKRISHYSKV